MALVCFVTFPDLDDCSPQDAIWVLSYVITVSRKGWDGLCTALCGCRSEWSECARVCVC